jgi:hypothetical protein
MFQLAVIGVIAPSPHGVVRGCVECRASLRDTAPCTGFGPGCLAAPRPQEAPSSRSRLVNA